MFGSGVEHTPEDRELRIVMILLCAQTFFIHVGQQLVVPILPLYARTFGVSTVAIGMMLTVQSIPRLFTSVPSGHLSDRVGAHRVLLVSCLCALVSAVTGGVAVTFGMLVVSRLVQGVASAISATAGLTYVSSIGDSTRRGRRIAVFQASHLLGNSIGPVVGGLVAQVWGYRAPFAVFAVIAGGTTVLVLRRLPDHRVLRDRAATTEGLEVQAWTGRFDRRAALRLLGSAGIALACFIGFVGAYTRSGTRNFGLVMLADLRGATEGEIGLLMSAIFFANVSVLYLTGMLVDRFGAKRVLVPGWLVMAGGLYLMTWNRGFGMLLAAVIVYGVGSGLGNSVPAMYIASVVAPHQRGVAMGIFRTFGDVGLIVGPMVMGWLIVATNVEAGITLNWILVLVALAVFAVFGPSAREKARGT